MVMLSLTTVDADLDRLAKVAPARVLHSGLIMYTLHS